MAIEQKTDENPQGQVEEKAITDEAPISDEADKKESEEVVVDLEVKNT